MHFPMHINPPKVSVVLDKRRMSTTGSNAGKYRIKLRVTFNVVEKNEKRWVQKLYPTKYFAGSSDELETIMQRPRSTEHRDVRSKLLLIQSNAETIINDHKITDQVAFELHFMSAGSVRSIDVLFNKKISELREADQISTAEKYETSLRVIKKFAAGEVMYGEITVKWLEKFKKWYTADRIVTNEKGDKITIPGRSMASFAIVARCIRHIFTMAIALKIVTVDQYPFGSGKFVIPAVRRAIKRYLTIAEKDKFLSFKAPSDFTAAAKDYWTFSYFCNGMNFADIANLKRKDIFSEYILIDRTKTANTDSNKKKIIIPIREEVKGIIARLGNKSLAPSDYVFPILEPGLSAAEKFKRVRAWVLSVNKGLKQIADALGIGHVTTYTARHTFANVILQSGGSTELIQDSLGHSDKRTTENYLDGFSLDIKKKYSSML